MFPPFFETMFWAVFITSLVFVALWWIILIIRMIKTRGRVQGQTASETQAIVKEKEIIREIVKIRWPYCGNLYDEKRINDGINGVQIFRKPKGFACYG
jgi:hypothetical protein